MARAGNIDSAAIDALFATWDKSDSPGASVVVSQRGRIVFEQGYGMADLSHDVPITPATPFHVASVSKQFTSAAILLLEQDGRLSVEDDICAYLPYMEDVGANIAIHHLLHHTSGLRDQWSLLRMAGYRLSAAFNSDLVTDADVMQLIRAQRALNFPPGSQYRYSNTGTTLLAQIVQTITGQSLREFTTERIFGPLGMVDTHFRDDHAEINPGEAFSYVKGQDGAWRVSPTNFDTVGPTSLFTTARDLALWDANFLSPKVGCANFAEMMSRTRPLITGRGNPYGFGLNLGIYRGARTVEHSGNDVGYNCHFVRLPEHDLGISVLANTALDAFTLSRRIVDAVVGEHLLEPANSEEFSPVIPVEEISRVSGVYRSPTSGAIIAVGSRDGQLVLGYGNVSSAAVALERGSSNVFRMPWGRYLTFDGPCGAASTAVTIRSDHGDSAERLSEAPRDAPARFAGTYESAELGVRYSVQDDGGELVMDQPRHPDLQLIHVSGDLFVVDSVLTIEFRRDLAGSVIGMLVSSVAGRAQDVQFHRTG